jgi:hypothetical protein
MMPSGLTGNSGARCAETASDCCSGGGGAGAVLVEGDDVIWLFGGCDVVSIFTACCHETG